jgi:hypothetical protein
MQVRLLLMLLLVLLPGWTAHAEDTWTGVERIVAVGDLHSDYNGLVRVLRSAAVIDAQGKWIGGKTHLVQTGDTIDRAADTRKVLDLLMSLEKQAKRAGGAVHCLIGNHESMNLFGDLRYVTAGDFASFRDRNSERLRDLQYAEHKKQAARSGSGDGAPVFDDEYRRKWDAAHPLGFFERQSFFAPDGLYGRWIRSRNTMIRINDLVFLHGGISPKYGEAKIKDLNRNVLRELDDFSLLQGGIVIDPEGPLWYRGLANGDEEPLRGHVSSVLERLGAKHIVIGHTPTSGAVMPRFGGAVILIDTGISEHYGARPACLLVEQGKMFAIHRGNKLEWPKDMAADLMRYMGQVAQIDSAVR